MPTVEVAHADGRYAIRIESGLLGRLGEAVREAGPWGRVLLAVDQKIARTHGETARKSLMASGLDACVHELVADEKRKSLETVRAMYDAMIAARLDRGSAVVALGGGIIGDVAGFAAATFLRGIAVVQVPTTLLAMVDAAIGGKTGVNLPLPNGSLGKNLIGAFWQPAAVLIDPQALRTLNVRDFRCGLAECVKHALIADADLLRFIEDHHSAFFAMDGDALTRLIHRSAAIKASIVQEDEREAGRRALLNLGHTFAHAIEAVAGTVMEIPHGEAVAIGLVAAMRCAVETHRLRPDEMERVRELLRALGLPVTLPEPTPSEQLIGAMGYDKKVSGGRMRFILPVGIGRAEVVDRLSAEVVQQAIQEIRPSRHEGMKA